MRSGNYIYGHPFCIIEVFLLVGSIICAGVAEFETTTIDWIGQAPLYLDRTGLDWPARLLEFEDEKGGVWAAHTDFGYIARRRQIKGMDTEA